MDMEECNRRQREAQERTQSLARAVFDAILAEFHDTPLAILGSECTLNNLGTAYPDFVWTHEKERARGVIGFLRGIPLYVVAGQDGWALGDVMIVGHGETYRGRILALADVAWAGKILVYGTLADVPGYLPGGKKTYSFTLVLEGKVCLTDEDAERIFAAGCDDCTPGVNNGVAEISFDREAGSWMEAIASAMQSVKKVFPAAAIEIGGIQVSNGFARVGDHVQVDMNTWEWDKSKPISEQNSPRMIGPKIRGCGTIIQIHGWMESAPGVCVQVETGMDRIGYSPEEVTLTPEHAKEA